METNLLITWHFSCGFNVVFPKICQGSTLLINYNKGDQHNKTGNNASKLIKSSVCHYSEVNFFPTLLLNILKFKNHIK